MTVTPELWQQISAAANQCQHMKIADAFASNPERHRQFSIYAAGIFCDFSKNLIDDTSFSHLMALAEKRNMHQKIKDLMQGVKVNHTEHRAALHTALRANENHRITLDGKEIHPEIKKAQHQVQQLTHKVHSGAWRGYTNKSITHVVNIGIGGSYLGPMMAEQALGHLSSTPIQCHYWANIDGYEAQALKARLPLEQTLFITASKSFSTEETLSNSLLARDWLLEAGATKSDLAHHFIAVSSNIEAAVEFGIAKENILPMWDWVGGRYSVWSAIGLPLALSLGWENYNELLSGANAMDTHFATAPLSQNMPVVLACLTLLYSSFMGAQSHGLLCYSHLLKEFVTYVQQLDMESVGKVTTSTGSPSPVATGPVVWGGEGTNGQHAYHQLLHQSQLLIPCDIIMLKDTQHSYKAHHQRLNANALAQSQALLQGKTEQQAYQELIEKGITHEEAERLAKHKAMPGNRPHNLLLLDKMSPFHLGALMALYEHKAYAQSVLWDINAFDQWGVELGKELGKGLLGAIQDNATPAWVDPSTAQLLDRLKGEA